MPRENGKGEIVRHVDELIARLQNRAYRPPLGQDFAEIYVEERSSDPKGESVPQRAPVPHADKKRERFMEMRRLAQIPPDIGYLSGSSDRLQAVLFYKQAKFMENFEDDYEGHAPFSMYFPNYQMMGYEQLRTYFTWRSKVRKGVVGQTSFSYVFLYIYELINNVGVKNCEDGFGKLAFIWKEYRAYEKKLDKYMNVWIRDYYITNEFYAPLRELLQKTGSLEKLYSPSVPESLFDFYYPYSEYKIKKSIFYDSETEKTIGACFDYVVRALDAFLLGQGGEFEDLIFYSKSNTWVPFSKALYCSFSGQKKNRTVILSDTEKYRCENGRWTSSKNKIPKENGRLIIGYILKRIEQFFRRVTKFKYRLTADPGKISLPEVARLVQDPQGFFRRIDAAILEYYRQSQRITVTVNAGRLETIRENAQKIQEKLLVGDEDAQTGPERPAAEPESEPAAVKPEDGPAAAKAGDIWGTFARSLNRTEKTAVRMILRGAPMGGLHAFAKSGGMMLEVLIDNINQKAIDVVGDNIIELSDTAAIFDEYKEDLKRVIGIECQ